MASITQSNSSYSFVTLIKLDQNNFILWRAQVLASIKGNGLEGFINGDLKCPEKFISLSSTGEASTSNESRSANPEFIAWMKTYQLLLSWMMSSIQQSLLSTVIDCATSKQLWESLNCMFISQSQARIQTLRMQIQTIKKGSITMAEYFSKIKRIADTLALTGKLVELGDFIMHVMIGLDSSDYESLITTILAREGTITLDDLYSLLLNHENRIDQKKSKIASDIMHHMSANVAKKDHILAKIIMDLRKIMEICFIPSHGANRCQNRFNPSFVPQKNFGRENFRGQFGRGGSFKNFGRGPNFSGTNFGNVYMPRGAVFQANMAYSDLAFIPSFPHSPSPYFSENVLNGMPSTSGPSTQATCAANPEIAKDPSWYIDSGATNHITNDLGKLVNPKAYVGNEQLYVGDGNALLINHVGSVKLTINTFEPFSLNHVLHVPKITKNLLSVSKLLADNNVTLKFVGTCCFVKARSTGIILLEGVVKGVVKASTFRVVLSIAVMNSWILRQIDVNNAFLNGILDEEVYMAQPEGFVNPQKPQHICKLKKAIHGLKQAPRAWFARFRTTMISQWHFQNSKSDNSIFYKRENGHLLLVLVYVDDIIITGSNSTKVQQVIQDIQKTFALKDLGELSYFLGIKVSKLQNGIHLSQAKYIVDILAKHDLASCSPVPTPMSTGQYLIKDSDSDWACDRDDRKSVAGFAAYLGPNLVSWSSKKQSVVSRSSAEAEYGALAHAASEVVWIKSLLVELQVQLSTTPLMWCDNQSAIALAYNPIYHAKTKHVELDIHFIIDKCKRILFSPKTHPCLQRRNNQRRTRRAKHIFKIWSSITNGLARNANAEERVDKVMGKLLKKEIVDSKIYLREEYYM
ncbi:reverse transcriptase Ty1/copia-type domain-containing protein [Citrus sinensis]|nr:reverse transcriptase Ty1/copia-type domain-containing protein [Citrus sinensis]